MLGTPYSLHQIAQCVYAQDLFQGIYENNPIHYIAYDTRTISHARETIFIALKTKNRDGHDFIRDAIEKGIKNFIVDRKIPFKDINYILVENTLDALQLWAMAHRQQFEYPVLAITGSNGKTTVKEWVATLLEVEFQIVKSPMSYNSQLGVPLSILQLHADADLAIIEAGISQKGEMEVLREIIQPSVGALTHMGEAHADGFSSEDEKLAEKLSLFEEVSVLLLESSQWWVQEYLENNTNILCNKIGRLPKDHLQVLKAMDDGEGWQILISDHIQKYTLLLPISGKAALENGLLAILIARHLGLSMKEIQERLLLLYPVEMRMEMITDNPEITIINDSYNADPDSIRNAFRLLSHTQVQPKKCIILTDIPHLGNQQQYIQKEILKEAIELVGVNNVHTIGEVYMQMRNQHTYLNTESLIRTLRYDYFQNRTVLLKGARSYELERILPYLNRKLNATYFQVNLNALAHNFRYLKSRVPSTVKSMCMLKASSYGSGTWEIARELELIGADYIAVAYASEGIELRQANIQLPIMVMNADVSSITALIQFDIEPEVYSFDFLTRYIRAARLAELKEYRIHLKFDTGMGRLGFREDDVEELIAFISQYPDINIISVMSHFAAADMPEEDKFTHEQVTLFQRIYKNIQEELGIFAFRHILNTSGILRFPEYAFEMIRMGIGLYGISPLKDSLMHDLQEIGSLHSIVSQLHTYPSGSSISYGRSQYTERTSLIATIPIGYADGIPRNLSNGKMRVLIRNCYAPVIGKICMDMLMIDVTEVPNVAEGDEVVILGKQGDKQISIKELATQAETIPYEILVRLSPRLRRIYVKE